MASKRPPCTRILRTVWDEWDVRTFLKNVRFTTMPRASQPAAASNPHNYYAIITISRIRSILMYNIIIGYYTACCVVIAVYSPGAHPSELYGIIIRAYHHHVIQFYSPLPFFFLFFTPSRVM